jgi:hypothetical protein
VSGTYTVSGNNVVNVGGQLSIAAAQNAGTITGNRVTLVVLPSQGTQIMHAFGPGSSISMTNTVLDITNSSTQSFDNNRGAFANVGGTVTLTDCTFTVSGSASGTPNTNNRGVEAAHEGSTLTATGTTITMNGNLQVGAFAFADIFSETAPSGGVLSLTSCKINVTGDDGVGVAIQGGRTLSATDTSITMIGNRDELADSYTSAIVLTNCNLELIGNDGFGIVTNDKRVRGSTISAKDTMISVTGDRNQIAAAYNGGVTTLDTSIINGSGTDNFALVAYSDKTAHQPLPPSHPFNH